MYLLLGWDELVIVAMKCYWGPVSHWEFFTMSNDYLTDRPRSGVNAMVEVMS